MSKVLTGINLVLVCLVLLLLLRPGGPARAFADEWNAARVQARVLERRWEEIGADGAWLDESGAPATASLVVFTDYECPFCKQFDSTLAEFRAAFPGRTVRVPQFPLSIHARARDAAAAAICADAQGRFASVHQALFAGAEWRDSASLAFLAKAHEVQDTAAFASCLVSDSTRAVIERDVKLAKEIGLDATPGVATQHVLRSGVMSLEELEVATDGDN